MPKKCQKQDHQKMRRATSTMLIRRMAQEKTMAGGLDRSPIRLGVTVLPEAAGVGSPKMLVEPGTPVRWLAWPSSVPGAGEGDVTLDGASRSNPRF